MALSPRPSTVEQAVPIVPAATVAPASVVTPLKKTRIFVKDGVSDFSYQNETLSEDVTWRGRVSVKGVLTISPQATLNIGPGTVVTFLPDDEESAEGALLVRGRLSARGTVAQPVQFKPATQKTEAGDWQGILLLGSDKKNLLEQCRIEGASTGLDAVFSTVSLVGTSFAACRTGARFQGALVQAAGGGVSDCDQGYILFDSEADIRETTFARNNQGLLLSGGSLHMTATDFSASAAAALESKGAKLSVQRSSFTGNGSGLTLSSSEGTVADNTITGNMEFGLRLTRSRMRVSGNVISRNTAVGIMADDGDAAVWGNHISSNGLYDLYNTGREDFRAAGNWWGTASLSQVKKRIFDRDDDSKRGAVLIYPLLAAAPELSPRNHE